MRVEMLSIADFYSNVDEVRAFAMQQEFFGEESHFPGKRTRSFLNDSFVIQSKYCLNYQKIIIK